MLPHLSNPCNFQDVGLEKQTGPGGGLSMLQGKRRKMCRRSTTCLILFNVAQTDQQRPRKLKTKDSPTCSLPNSVCIEERKKIEKEREEEEPKQFSLKPK
jgi:hypothetical protein